MQTNHTYAIHDLITINISQEVRPEVVREIDFQIGAFKTKSDLNLDDQRHRIDVFPFEYVKNFIDKNKPTVKFYDLKGCVGKFFINEKESFFVKRTDNGFLICADYANFLINLYIQILIIEQGFSMIHAAAYINKNGVVNVLTGAGGIGKTSILGYAVGERGLQHLGDDIVLLGKDGKCKAFPREFVLKKYHREQYSKVFKEKSLPKWNAYGLKRFIVENAPFVGLAKNLLKKVGIYYTIASILRPQPHLATVSPDELFGAGTMALDGTVGLIAYMDRTDSNEFTTENVNVDVLVNRITSVIHYEWKDFTSHLLCLGAFDIINLTKYISQTEKNIKAGTSNIQLLQINIPNNATPRELIAFLEKKDFF